MEEVTLEQVLAARDARTQRQNALLERYHMPVISFSMNIPGPVKDSPLIRRAYFTGRDALLKTLKDECVKVLRKEETLAATGCEIQIAVKEDALTVKKLCVQIEDATTLGRLFDMDVLTPDGEKLDREAVGGSERGCIVCGAAAMGSGAMLGRVGGMTIVLYLCTTFVAITQMEVKAAKATSLADTLLNIFPTNVVSAMASGAMLQIIVPR